MEQRASMVTRGSDLAHRYRNRFCAPLNKDMETWKPWKKEDSHAVPFFCGSCHFNCFTGWSPRRMCCLLYAKLTALSFTYILEMQGELIKWAASYSILL